MATLDLGFRQLRRNGNASFQILACQALMPALQMSSLRQATGHGYTTVLSAFNADASCRCMYPAVRRHASCCSDASNPTYDGGGHTSEVGALPADEHLAPSNGAWLYYTAGSAGMHRPDPLCLHQVCCKPCCRPGVWHPDDSAVWSAADPGAVSVGPQS